MLRRRLLMLAMASAIAFGAAGWWEVTPTAAASTVYVATDVLNVRARPSLSAPVITRVYAGDAVLVTGTVRGPAVGGNTTWYRTVSGYYVAGAYLSTSRSAGAAAVGGSGTRWIDINLATLTARAMVGNSAVYTAPIVSGKPGWETPTGRFRIHSRYRFKDMTSASFGVGPGHPEYYYQPAVPYTQFFDYAGDAIHGNYWSPANAFGNYNTSHGCVGLRVGDAAYFWNFASIGTPVSIHF